MCVRVAKEADARVLTATFKQRILHITFKRIAHRPKQAHPPNQSVFGSVSLHVWSSSIDICLPFLAVSPLPQGSLLLTWLSRWVWPSARQVGRHSAGRRGARGPPGRRCRAARARSSAQV
eukprot:6185710-Pleurochrysis_carterae.AAC.1